MIACEEIVIVPDVHLQIINNRLYSVTTRHFLCRKRGSVYHNGRDEARPGSLDPNDQDLKARHIPAILGQGSCRNVHSSHRSIVLFENRPGVSSNHKVRTLACVEIRLTFALKFKRLTTAPRFVFALLFIGRSFPEIKLT